MLTMPVLVLTGDEHWPGMQVGTGRWPVRDKRALSASSITGKPSQ